MLLNFKVNLKNVSHKSIRIPSYGSLIFDGYTEDGVRLHVVDKYLEHPTVWRNAILFGKNHVKEEVND